MPKLPVAVRGRRHPALRCRGQGLYRRLRGTARLLPRSTLIRMCSRLQRSSTVWPMPYGFLHTEAAERLADRLVADAPDGLDHVYLVSVDRKPSGGAEDGSAVLRGEGRAATPPLSRAQSYPRPLRLRIGGRATSGGALNSGRCRRNPPHRSMLRLWLQQAGESDADYAARAAAQLEARSSTWADQVIAFVAETVVGATAGAVPPRRGLFEARSGDLRQIRSAADPRPK